MTMNPVTAVMWMFLVIFAVTAIMTLWSLPARGLSIPDKYRSKLFFLLLAEVIGVVIIFARSAFQGAQVPADNLHSALVASADGWDWQYAEKGWRTRARFDQVGPDTFSFSAATEVVDRGGEAPTIIQWQ